MRENGTGFDEVARLMDIPKSTIIDHEKHAGWITSTNLNREMRKIEEEGRQLPLCNGDFGVVPNENDTENSKNGSKSAGDLHNSLNINTSNRDMSQKEPQTLQELIETKGMTIETRAQIMLSHELDIAEKTALMAGQLLLEGLRKMPNPETIQEAKAVQSILKTAVDTVRPKDNGPNIQVNLFNQERTKGNRNIDI